MRRRSAALLASGALAIGGLVLPSFQEHESRGDARFLGATVNNGSPVVLDPTGSADIGFSITVKDDSGIKAVDHVGLWGPNTGVLQASAAHCTAKSATVSVCTGTSSVSVTKKQVYDDMAGHWHVQATVHAKDGDTLTDPYAGAFSILKDGQLTEYGAPHTAAKGSLIGIGGQLKKPDWDSQSWVPNSGQQVLVQFTPRNGTRAGTVAEATTDANGMVSVTVRTTVTGVYTLVYQGAFWAEPAESTPAQVTVGS